MKQVRTRRKTYYPSDPNGTLLTTIPTSLGLNIKIIPKYTGRFFFMAFGKTGNKKFNCGISLSLTLGNRLTYNNRTVQNKLIQNPTSLICPKGIKTMPFILQMSSLRPLLVGKTYYLDVQQMALGGGETIIKDLVIIIKEF